MTDTLPPREIRWFEIVQIVSIALGLFTGLTAPEADWVGSALVTTVLLALTLLISRRRKNWARWVLTAAWGLGLASTIYLVPEIIASGASAPLIIVQVLLQGAGIALLFTRRSSAWLRRRPGGR